MNTRLAGGSAVHRGLVWLLIGALCAYASSGAMLRILGPAHWHAAPAPVTSYAASAAASVLSHWLGPTLQQVRALVADIHSLSEQAHAQAHAMGIAPHTHSHSSLLRHWHNADDDSVRTVASDVVDPELADLKAAAAIGSATLLPALGPAHAWQVPAQPNGAWPPALAAYWRSADMTPPVEPPIA